MPPERDYSYIECSTADGFWGAVERDGKPMCTRPAGIEVTSMNTIFVTISLSAPKAVMGSGSLTLNFEVPAQGVPTDDTIDALTMGRYDGVEGTRTVTSASIVIREDEEGALGSYQATVEGPDGTIVFDNGVYYTGPITRP